MWYYAENSEQKGPVTLEDLVSKIQSGELTGDTLVWTNNMRNWEKACEVQDLKEFIPAAPAAPEPPPVVQPEQPEQQPAASAFQPAAPVFRNDTAAQEPEPINLQKADDTDTIKLRPVAVNPQPSAAGYMLTCQQCGRPVSPAEALNYQGTIVCPACKPQFLHDLYERHGANNVDYPAASFWQRFGAYLIDSIIIGIVSQIVALPIGFIVGAAASTTGVDGDAVTLISSLFGYLVGLFIYVVYVAGFLCKFGATPGKMILGLKVLHNGEYPGLGRSIGRAFAMQLSGILCSIGYIMAAFNQETKALHDYICDTVVVSTK